MSTTPVKSTAEIIICGDNHAILELEVFGERVAIKVRYTDDDSSMYTAVEISDLEDAIQLLKGFTNG